MIYEKAGSIVVNAVASGSANKLAHQLVDVMSIATDDSVTVERVVEAAHEASPDLAETLDALVAELRGQTEREKRLYVLAWIHALIAVLSLLGFGQGEVSTPPPEETVIVQQITEVHKQLIQILVEPTPRSGAEGGEPGAPTPERPEHDDTPPPRP